MRALLIDKDKAPRWNPLRLADVTPERVQTFFAGFRPSAGKTRRQA